MQLASIINLPRGAAQRFRAPAAASFPAAFAIALIVALAEGAKPFYYDALGYWRLGGAFTGSGSFSLLAFADPVRGYLFPLVNHLLDVLVGGLGFGDSTVVNIFNAAIIGVLGTVLAPRFAQLVWPEIRFGAVRRLALSVLLLVFWRGYLSFPLTDFPALAAALLSIVIVGSWRSPPALLGAGLAAGAAVNLRPAFILVVPALLALAVLRWKQSTDNTPGPSLGGLALLVAGLVLISLPQSLAMHRHHGTWNPVPGSVAGLSNVQLTVGLERQRYETYVGDDYPQAGMVYYDDATADIRAELSDGTVDGYAEYLQIVVQHPLTMTGVFVRHIINGFDQRYPTPYVEEIDTSRAFRWLNFTVLYLALLRIAWPSARRGLGTIRWRYALALMATCATVLPSGMETRFVLPLYLLGYLLVLAPGWPNPLRERRRGSALVVTPAVIGSAYVAYMAVMWLVVRETTNQLMPPP